MGSSVSACGNLSTAVVLGGTDALVSLLRAVSLGIVDLIDWVCSSGRNTSRNKVAWHPPRYSNTPVYASENSILGDLDVEKTMAQSKFPIPPEKLIAMAKEIMGSEFGTKQGAKADCLAEDFQFVAPIIGPLGKEEFMKAFGSFKLKEAVPDLADNSWFQVDPLEPNRVWFFARATGTHTGTLNFARPIPPTNKRIEAPPQAQSMLFNEQGQCYTLTVGYCMDKRIGNTEGLGGVFGILKAVGHGLPFPEGQRLYTPSLRYEAFERVAKFAEALGFGPNARPSPRE
ncbi:GONST5 [Symbiodinium sp. CCMP2456]|nr:GONST5 [Symbiodinium sp. CCMP2456]